MNNMAQLQFIKKSTAPETTSGTVWFDSREHKIKVKTDSGWESFTGIQPTGSATLPIYIDENGNAKKIDSSKFLKSGDILQRYNNFLEQGGGFISELHNSFFDGHRRLFNVKVNNQDANEDQLNILFSIDNYENQAYTLEKTTTFILTGTDSTGYIFQGNLDYGYLVLNFYYEFTPADVTCRVYCNYEQHGIGWHELDRNTNIEYGSHTNGRIIFYNPYYRCSQIEIIITPQENRATQLTSIEYYLTRCPRLESSAVNKTSEIQNFRGKLVAKQGFEKIGSSNNQVLLGGGGSTDISSLKVNKAETASSLEWIGWS